MSSNPTKWSDTLKQFVGKFSTNCLSVFDHFAGLARKGLSIVMIFAFAVLWNIEDMHSIQTNQIADINPFNWLHSKSIDCLYMRATLALNGLNILFISARLPYLLCNEIICFGLIPSNFYFKPFVFPLRDCLKSTNHDSEL